MHDSGHSLFFCRRNLFCCLLGLLLLLTISLLAPVAVHAQIDTGGIVPHRYLIVYRDPSVPPDVEAHIASAGARLLHQNQHLGIATVTTPASESDTEALNRLALQPGVAYVLHDRIVFAHRVFLRPVEDESVRSNPTGTTSASGPGKLPTHGPIHPGVPSLPSGGQTAPPPPTTTPQPYDTYYSTPQAWAVQQVGGYGNSVAGGPAHGPWDTTRGEGVRIAILDSGIDATHPDLAPNLTLNLSEIDQSAFPSACDDGSPQDQSGHGTWTASLAAGAMGPGTGQLIGVAPSASLLNIKVLERVPGTGATLAQQCESGEATGLLSWVMQGIDDAITNHADVISLSLGMTADLSTGDGAGLLAAFNQVTYAAATANVVLVASAGNDAIDLSNPRYIALPAQARDVLAITASTNPACAENLTAGSTCSAGPITLPYYSNYGAPLNAVSAPGGSYPEGGDAAVTGWVRGACSSGLPNTIDGVPSDASHSFGCFNLGHTAYVQAIGTSASAPLAAGVAALVRAAHPAWSATTVVDVLRASATAFSTLPFPLVSASAALNFTPTTTNTQPATRSQFAVSPSSALLRYGPTSLSHPLF